MARGNDGVHVRADGGSCRASAFHLPVLAGTRASSWVGRVGAGARRGPWGPRNERRDGRGAKKKKTGDARPFLSSLVYIFSPYLDHRHHVARQRDGGLILGHPGVGGCIEIGRGQEG